MNPADHIKFDKETNVLHIENTGGVRFLVGGKVASGDIKLTKNTTVRAYPRGRLFDEDVTTEWRFNVSDTGSAEVEATQEEETQPNEVEDIPEEPTAGTDSESPEQQAKTGGLSFGRPNIP